MILLQAVIHFCIWCISCACLYICFCIWRFWMPEPAHSGLKATTCAPDASRNPKMTQRRSLHGRPRTPKITKLGSQDLQNHQLGSNMYAQCFKEAKKTQRRSLQGPPRDTQNHHPGSNVPSHRGLHVQKHRNMSKTCTWIAFCFS